MTSQRSVPRLARWIGCAALCAALCGALLSGTLAGTVPPASAASGPMDTPPAAAPSVPMLDWQPCDDGFLCATATVPLDYAHPRGATIHLAVIKRPATDPAHRIGSIFFNQGGPHDGGVLGLPAFYPFFPPAIRARFDVISWDQRGLGQSTHLQCFDNIDQENQLLSALPSGHPEGPAQERLWEKTVDAFDTACAVHGGPLLAHITTADTARDMDLLRQAVGDPTMNFLGTSYGTYVGATYANLFPDKVRALTFDGNADPVAWATGTDGSVRRQGTFLRMGLDKGLALVLNAFLDLCGRTTTNACAFSAGSPAATRAKWDTLLDRLDSRPVTLGGRTITKAGLVDDVSDELGIAAPLPGLDIGWPAVARSLQTIWTVTNGGPAPANNGIPLRASRFTGPKAATSYLGLEVHWGIVCSDSPNPRNLASYPAQAAFATARSGVVGAGVAWTTAVCAHWPVLSSDRYTGPWNHRTAAPILVLGNTFDPLTPYANAVAMSHDLANARLLTIEGYGHSSFLNHSNCATAIEEAYYVTGALPAPGTVCQQDRPPFPG